ncbi:MAG: TonB-dependent siderophore receptor [Puniceicoccaceae bacterium]
MHKNDSFPSRLVPVAIFTFLSPLVGLAQDSDDQVFELSAFEVAVEEDRGYFSPNSVVATGFSQEIFKTPLNISALTDQFLQDTGIENLDEAIGYMSGVQVEKNLSQPQAGYRSRGFTTRWGSRNGIRQYSSSGADNIDRVEVIKGPASVFFGQVSPGGVVNFTTKRPSFNAHHELNLKIGSYDYKRAEVASQGPLWEGAPVAYRINLSYLDKEDWRDFEFEERSFVYGGLQWQPFQSLKFFAEYEQVDSEYMYAFSLPRGNQLWIDTVADLPPELIEQALTDPRYNPDRWTPEEFANLLYNSNFLRFAADYETVFDVDVGSPVKDVVPGATPFGRRFNQHGPGGWRVFESEIATYEANWTPSDWLAVRAIHTTNENFRPGYLQVSTELESADGDIDPIITSQTYGNDSSYSALEGVSTFDLGPGSHRFLFGASYFEDQFRTYQFDKSPQPPAWLDQWNPAEEGYIDIREDIIFENGLTPTGGGQDNFIRAYYASYVGNFFEDRLTVMAGIRNETFHNRFLSQFERTSSTTFDGRTPMGGIVWEFTEGVSFFGCYSKGYLPGEGGLIQGDGATDAERNLTVDNKEGEGIDIGFKAQTADNKLSGTLSFFQVSFTNDIKTRDFEREEDDPRNNDDDPRNDVVWFKVGGESQTRGMELDFIYTPVPSMQVVFSYAWMWQAEVLDNETAPEQEGNRLANAPEHSGSIWTKYSFEEGLLEGFSIGMGAKYKDRVWLKIQPDRNTFQAPPYVVVDALIEYNTTIRGVDTRFALNVTNLFDKEYIGSASGNQSGSVPGDVRKVFFSVGFRL